jgi:hypothetical protein
MQWPFHKFLLSSVIINQIHVANVLARHSEYDPMIARDRHAPKTAQISRQAMQPAARKVNVPGLFRLLEQSEQSFHFVDKVGTNLATIPFLVQ